MGWGCTPSRAAGPQLRRVRGRVPRGRALSGGRAAAGRGARAADAAGCRRAPCSRWACPRRRCARCSPAGCPWPPSTRPDRCVVSGPVEEVERLTEELKRREAGAVRHARAPCVPLRGRGALHARAGAGGGLAEALGAHGAATSPASRARWPPPGKLADPATGRDQMRQPVRFASGVEALLDEGCALLLEVGPGRTSPPWSAPTWAGSAAR